MKADKTEGHNGGRNWFPIACRQADLRSLLKASHLEEDRQNGYPSAGMENRNEYIAMFTVMGCTVAQL